MKRLILVRHAKTEPFTSAGSDFDRKLKKRGKNDSLLVAEDIKSRGVNPDVIITSPAIRALETTEVLAKVFGIPQSKIHQARFVYDGDTTAAMLDGIANLVGVDDNTVMLVGHNPDVASLSMKLTNEHFFHFPTCAATVISFSISNWADMNVGTGRCEYFVYPKMLKDK